MPQRSACPSVAATAHAPPQPFLDTNNPLQDFFPDRYYAVAIPAVLLVLAITLVTAFVGMVIMKSAAKKKAAAAAKKDT